MGLGDRLAAGPGAVVDAELASGDQQEEDEVEDDHYVEGVKLTGEFVLGDGQWNADALVVVETPVGRGGQQWNGGQDKAEDPDHSAGDLRRPAVEAQLTERKAKHEETVQGEEANQKSGYFAGRQGQKTGHAAGCAVPPGNVFPQVRPLVHSISHADDGQVQPHEKVRDAEVRYEDPEAQSVAGLVDNDAVREAAQIANQRQDSEDGENHAVSVRPQQGVAGGDLVSRSVAVDKVET